MLHIHVPVQVRPALYIYHTTMDDLWKYTPGIVVYLYSSIFGAIFGFPAHVLSVF